MKLGTFFQRCPHHTKIARLTEKLRLKEKWKSDLLISVSFQFFWFISNRNVWNSLTFHFVLLLLKAVFNWVSKVVNWKIIGSVLGLRHSVEHPAISKHCFTVLNSFQLSAISSVAILNDTQRAALQYVITRSAQDSKSVASKLLARVQRLGYSENDLKRYVLESRNIFSNRPDNQSKTCCFRHPGKIVCIIMEAVSTL